MKLPRSTLKKVLRKAVKPRPRPKPEPQETPETAPRPELVIPAELRDVNLRLKSEAAGALEGIRNARKEDRVGRALTALSDKIAQLGTAPPRPGPPGTVGVRAVAASGEKKGRLVPLVGLSVRAVLADGIETPLVETDPTGFALLELPRSGGFEVQALGSQGRVLASQRGSLADGGAEALLLDVGSDAAVTPHLERGRKLDDALKRTAERIAGLKKDAEEALQKREGALTERIKRLDAILATRPRKGR